MVKVEFLGSEISAHDMSGPQSHMAGSLTVSSNTQNTLLFPMHQKNLFGITHYILCEIQYVKHIRMPYCSRWQFAACK